MKVQLLIFAHLVSLGNLTNYHLSRLNYTLMCGGHHQFYLLNGTDITSVFVDDFTHFCLIYPMKVKSKAKAVFIKFHNFVERQINCKIKSMQTDWGGEFQSLLPLLDQLGVLFRHPCPHVHEQNGKVERKHRHVVETGLTLLAQAVMPLTYWWTAFSSAVYLINRLPTSTLHMVSPFEAVYHKKPNYMQLKVFGCSCYPYLRPYNKHKL